MGSPAMSILCDLTMGDNPGGGSKFPSVINVSCE